MEVTVKNLQKKTLLNLPTIEKIAKLILKKEGINKVCLSMTFVTGQKICALNKKFLKRNRSTDVLAFDLSDAKLSYKKRKTKEIFGDIIISTDAAIKNSKIYGSTLCKELGLYIIHGILHLIGFDDHKPADVSKIRKKEQQLLDFLGKRTANIIKK